MCRSINRLQLKVYASITRNCLIETETDADLYHFLRSVSFFEIWIIFWDLIHFLRSGFFWDLNNFLRSGLFFEICICFWDPKRTKFGLTIYCCSIRNIPITNEKVFKYQSAGDKTIEIVESAKLPHQDTWHLPLATGALARRTDSSEDSVDMCFSFERSAMNGWHEVIFPYSE